MGSPTKHSVGVQFVMKSTYIHTCYISKGKNSNKVIYACLSFYSLYLLLQITHEIKRGSVTRRILTIFIGQDKQPHDTHQHVF